MIEGAAAGAAALGFLASLAGQREMPLVEVLTAVGMIEGAAAGAPLEKASPAGWAYVPLGEVLTAPVMIEGIG
jgi:hypothetical protein